MRAPLVELPVVVMRGGTSKGVFCRLSALPPAGPERDRFLLSLLGSPDPMQLDGLGGTHSSTSKVVAVAPSREAGVDVEYLFAQIGVERALVDYAGNCGNLTAAVGPYAVDEGLVLVDGDCQREIVLANLNTGVRIRARVPVVDGRAAWAGSCTIDGVPGSGAPVVTDYLDPAGSVTGKLLPTGAAVDVVDGVEVSIVDVATPYAFVRAETIGLTGDEAPAELNRDRVLLERLEALRRACGAAVGLASAAVPRLVLVAPATRPDAALAVRVTSMQKVHHATPITGALCTAAAVRIAGTVAAAVAGGDAGRLGGPAGAAGGSDVVGIQHPKGLVEATVDMDDDGHVRSAGVVRTARRLLAGTAYVPLR